MSIISTTKFDTVRWPCLTYLRTETNHHGLLCSHFHLHSTLSAFGINEINFIRTKNNNSYQSPSIQMTHTECKPITNGTIYPTPYSRAPMDIQALWHESIKLNLLVLNCQLTIQQAILTFQVNRIENSYLSHFLLKTPWFMNTTKF